jgi:hypothetical protein
MVGLEFFMQHEVDSVRRYCRDLRAVQEARGDDVEDLSNFSTQYAAQVEGLLAGQCGVCGVSGCGGTRVGDPSAAHA